MRVVVTGATGNIGTSVVDALATDEQIEQIVGLARRESSWSVPKLTQQKADVSVDDLTERFRGADAVIHLAWLFQPTHDPATTWRANVLGSIRVFEAVERAGVPTLVYGSSVGAYSPAPQHTTVAEDWPTHGWPEAAYTREKAYLERALDGFENANPQVRVVRMRPGFVFKWESAPQQRRLFLGPFVPGALVRPEALPVVPDISGLQLQVVHSTDLGDAFRRATRYDVRGAFNVATEPVLDAGVLAELFGARRVRMPVGPVRGALAAVWWLHLAPASPGLFDAVLRLPVMDCVRARAELGWTPRYSSQETLSEFLAGLRSSSGQATPPLRGKVPGGRWHEIRTGVGARE